MRTEIKCLRHVHNHGHATGVAIYGQGSDQPWEGRFDSSQINVYTREEAMEQLVGERMSRGGNVIITGRSELASFGAYSQICTYETVCLVGKMEEYYPST